MTNPQHISAHIDTWFKARFFNHLLHKYNAKSLDDLHIRMFNELEQEIYFKIINKRSKNNG
jgi:hypothetical protein